MYVVDDLRMPGVVNLVDGELRFNLREGVPVAVVIVACVLVVELGRIGAFERSVECFVVPVLNDVYAVRVELGNEKNDRIVEYLLNLGFARRGKPVSDEHAGKIRPDLRRVDAASNQHNCFSTPD